MRGLFLPYLAGLQGLELRRAERTCRDLAAAGIQGVHPHPIAREKSTGEFTGLPAIRTLSQTLFRAFNLALWLKHSGHKNDPPSGQRHERTG